MERFIPAPDSYYNPEFPVDSDDDEEPLGGWNPPDGTHHEEVPEPIPAPCYTEADLYPTGTNPDPACPDPEWPLACYWPVYVSNFRLDDLDEGKRNVQVANFFAANGLLARMIFVWERERCFYYRAFQQMSLLMDMLVYFVREEDAERAVRVCHRRTYYGHRLNVWPGRRAVYFEGSRSVGFALAKACCAEKSESMIELMFRRNVGPCVETVARLSLSDVVVEFSSEETMRAGVRTARWLPKELTEATRKQRFLEQDVQADLLAMIAEKPVFMDMVPEEGVLRQLLEGKIPNVDRSWENVPQPRALPESTVSKYRRKREHRVESLKRNHERKRNGEFNVLLDGAPQAKKQVTVKQRRAQVQQEADRILGEGSPSQDRFRYSMLRKNQKYCNLRLRLLNSLKRKPPNAAVEERNMFYEMLAMEEELMDLLPRAEEYFGCLRLELGLSKAVLVAGDFLPFPEISPISSCDEPYEDIPPPGDARAVPEQVLAVRPYSEADLTPNCDDDPNWPLANFWPVHVNNFRINTLEVERRNDQIRDYFATKGLLATLIFVQDSDRHYKWFQAKLMLLDFLVYFTSQEDALKAIELCHRESYYGHYLNVFPGREPSFFDLERSGFTKTNFHEKGKRANHPTMPSTTYIEENILEVLPQDVTCVVRPTEDHVFFEFVQRDPLTTLLPRLKSEFHSKSGPLEQPKRKQRFLESDVKDQLARQLRDDPTYLQRQRPRPEVLLALCEGAIPGALLSWNWFGWVEPRKGRHAKMSDVRARIRQVLRIWRQLQEEFGLI